MNESYIVNIKSKKLESTTRYYVTEDHEVLDIHDQTISKFEEDRDIIYRSFYHSNIMFIDKTGIGFLLSSSKESITNNLIVTYGHEVV